MAAAAAKPGAFVIGSDDEEDAGLDLGDSDDEALNELEAKHLAANSDGDGDGSRPAGAAGDLTDAESGAISHSRSLQPLSSAVSDAIPPVLQRPRGRPSERFAERGFTNVPWLLLFLATVVTTVIVEFTAGIGRDLLDASSWMAVLLSVVLSVTLGGLLLVAHLNVTQQLLWLSQFVSICMAFFFSALLLFVEFGSRRAALAVLCVGVGMALWLHAATKNNQLQFACVLMELVSKVLASSPSLKRIAGGVVLAQTAWLVVLVLCTYSSLYSFHSGAYWVFLALVLFWTSQFFKHVAHMVSAATVAYWYLKMDLASGNERAPRDLAAWGLRRALGANAGTVCYGSFFVAWVRALYVPLRAMATSGSTALRTLVGRPFRAVEALHANLNKFGFTHVVVYGQQFRAASRESWSRFVACGVDQIIFDDKVESLLLFPCLGAGFAVASVAGVLMYMIGGEALSANWVEFSVIFFWFGFVVAGTALETIEGGISAVFACFSEEPLNLAETHPLVFYRFLRISEFRADAHGARADDDAV